jgi:hypothetical protein
MARKRGAKSAQSRKKGGGGDRDARWQPQSASTAVTRSYNVPPRNYLKENFGGITPSIRRTLVWHEQTGGALPSNSYKEFAVIVLNSPYDPDNAVGGTSAQGFAKYMAFYSKCFVLGARIKVKGVRAQALNAGPAVGSVVCGLTVTTNNTSLGAVDAAIQDGLCDYQFCGANPDRTHAEIGVDIAKFVDKPDLLDDSQFFCTSSSNPSQLVCAHIWALNISASTTEVWNQSIEVEFDCVFTDPIPFS